MAAPVLSIDVPSGLDAATGRAAPVCFRAERTVTFHALKVGHLIEDGPDVCGQIDVADIGLIGGEPALLLTEAGDAPRPRRRRREHKWSAGAVLVVGGGAGMTGAAMLAAHGALRSGAGAVAIAAPPAAQPIYASLSPDVLVRAVGSGDRFAAADAEAIVGSSERFGAIVLGPGLGQTPPGFVAGIVEAWAGTLVLDADGIGGLAGIEVLAERPGPTILTPHAGEFSRLTGTDATIDEADRLAGHTGCVVLLKGNPTVVASDVTWIVASGGPELATIGTGDVLAGMIGAFAAAGLPPEVAARSAAYHHGEAGRRLAARGRFLASELAIEIGR
ncbi:MAG: NAD(P)H-hydrate dehydratase [Actinobacteria bacterium]|nr:MAG: NAD(P)H-hydrate dehydratase [Actinomycetota bacterium]